MKPKIKFQVHKWNSQLGRWEPLCIEEAYTKRQACYFVSLRHPLRMQELSAKTLASVEDIPLEEPQP